MPKVTPFLWFNNNAEEAMNFYTEVFKNSKVVSFNGYGGSFSIDGQEIMVLNGGPEFKFTEAFSLFVNCEDQTEVDDLWTKLTADGGQEGRCGWLKDKFGLSWQIIPKQLGELMGDPDPAKSQQTVQAMMKMNKIIVADLQKAHDAQ
jgi:predicted 3-demethylubiquinone-9 3-methyltransferase (glyoxalase superfamily)